MKLTNYWQLLIWLFAAGAFLSLVTEKKQELVCGRVEKRWSKSAALILVIPYIIWAGFRSDSWGDSPLSSMGQKNMRGEWH